MNNPDSISDLVAHRISYTGSYLSARGLAPTRLSSNWLGSRLMTWQVGPTLLTCQLTGCWHGMPTMHDDVIVTSGWRHPACWLCMMTSQLRHADVILIRVRHVGRVNWYSGWVSPSGWRRRVARVCARGLQPSRCVTTRADVADVRFRRCFHQWLCLFLLYKVVWSKHNFDNFYFWAKSNTT